MNPPWFVWLATPWSKVAHQRAAGALWTNTACGHSRWTWDHHLPRGVAIDPGLLNRAVVRPCKSCWPERPEWW